MQMEFHDTGARTGAFNMEFDTARAHAVDAGTAAPMLRTYHWDPWCVSLGRHQSEDDLDMARLAADGLDWVRRPTGGRAILHAEELTYSVVMPGDRRGVMEVYKFISEALVCGLQKLADTIDIAKAQPDFQKLYKEPGSIPCFSSSARYEIEVEGRKLVGSAQRRIGSAVLQHGSILIGDAHLRLPQYLAVAGDVRTALAHDMTSHTTTLNAVAGRTIRYEDVRDALRAGFAEAWGAVFTDVHANAYIPHRKEATPAR
jgi:lipoyl(octanoyl) transferase